MEHIKLKDILRENYLKNKKLDMQSLVENWQRIIEETQKKYNIPPTTQSDREKLKKQILEETKNMRVRSLEEVLEEIKSIAGGRGVI